MNDRILLQRSAEDEGCAFGLVVGEDYEDPAAAGGDVFDFYIAVGKDIEGQGHAVQGRFAESVAKVVAEQGEVVLDVYPLCVDLGADPFDDFLCLLVGFLPDAYGYVAIGVTVLGVEHVEDVDSGLAQGIEEDACHTWLCRDSLTCEAHYPAPPGEQDSAHL